MKELKNYLPLTDILEKGDVNLCPYISKEDLVTIAECVIEGYENDDMSRSIWLERTNEWMKLAMQVRENKSFPWDGAANVKYPLITIAALQFNARAFPALINPPKLVQAYVIGDDKDGAKADKAKRVTDYMSWQLTSQMDNWIEDTDRLLLSVSILGNMFKKVYYDPGRNVCVSEVIFPRNLVVDYEAKSLKSAQRVTHTIFLSKNEYMERVRSSIFVDTGEDKNAWDVPKTDISESEQIFEDMRRDLEGMEPADEEHSNAKMFLEQHCYIDLDNDGYEEPYIVTVCVDTRSVVRIVTRFAQQDISYNADAEVVSIVPEQYFIKYSFIPNPDGGFYDVGFGVLLGPINEVSNTLLNQLIDAGTLANMQGGFLSRGIRIKSENMRLSPGQWMSVNAMGDDLRKGIVPIPAKDPSQVLFNLLGMVLDGGRLVANVTDMMAGQNPGQNQPAMTSMAVLEQGLKVFTSIYNRIYRSLGQEYKMLYFLNGRNMNVEDYFTVLDTSGVEVKATATRVYQTDFDISSNDIIPAADPRSMSQSQRLAKAQALLELLPLGINKQEAVRRTLDAQDQPNIEALMTPEPQQPPQPSPETMLGIERLKFDAAKYQMDSKFREEDLRIKRIQVENEAAKDDAVAALALAKAETEMVKVGLVKTEIKMKEIMMQLDVIRGTLELTDMSKQFSEQKAVDDSKAAGGGQQPAGE